jgi:GTPase-associated adaptor domain-containing protein/calcineurin-like phosphoesterase family protein
MTRYRFVHLSDIHFGQEKNGSLPVHEDVRAQIIRDSRQLSQDIGSANGILITGDTAFSGKREEYLRAGDWLDELITAVGCGDRSVGVVPGNHDVDVEKIGLTGKWAHQALRDARPENVDSILEEIAKSDEVTNPLLPKFGAYREFAARYECDFESAQRPSWLKEYHFARPNVLRFLGLNSVQVSDLTDDLGRMVLGNTQYIIGSEDDNCEYIVLMHHPPSWLKDRQKAEQYLRRARVIMVGHEHDLRIRKVTWDDDSEHLEIYAGATNPEDAGGVYQYRYNWVEFEYKSEGGDCTLIVTIYPRVWDMSNPRFVPDTMRLGGRPSMSFSLVCPRFRLPDDTVEPTESFSDETCAVEAFPIAVNANMRQDEVEHFARLKYFFWKYLDWQQRLEVLVLLDILPSTSSQPVPQTMERLALESAQKQRKLPGLWEAVMKYVPEDKRERNPFTPEVS